MNITNAERLLKLRTGSGLSIQEFAEHFSIPYNTYCQWESGRRNPPEYIINMIEHITTMENAMSDRIALTKKIERIEKYLKVLKEAGMHCPDDSDVAKFVKSGNLETIKKGAISYYLFKDDTGYQVCYMPEFDKFLEKEEIKALTA